MIQRRLLMGGGGAFTAPTTPITLTTANDGGWPGNQVTNAVYYNGYTYFGYIDGSGNVELRSLADGSSTPSAPVVLVAAADWLEIDWHDAPALLVRSSDHKLIAAYCRHSSGANMYVKISTNSLDSDPTISGGFAAATDWGATIGGSEFTYPRLIQLTSETNDPIYLFFRSYISAKSTLLYSKSTDQGATFTSRVAVFQQNAEAYWSTDTNGTDRIDFGVTDGTGGTASVYHFYYTGGNYYKTDGTLIGSSTLGTADITLVYSGATNGAKYVGSIARNGGNPVLTFPAGATEVYQYAAWSGGVWNVNDIVAAGHAGDAWIEGGAVVDPGTPTICYVSTYISAQWQIVRYTTANLGVSWSTSQLTTASDASIYPHIVAGYGSTLRVIWLYGTATAYTSYSFGIVGIA